MNSNIKAYLALSVICVVWGTTFLATRIGLVDIPPVLFVSIRHFLGATIFLLFALIVQKKKITFSSAKPYLIAGIFVIFLGNTIISLGLKYFPNSGLATIICALMPIWVIFLNYLDYFNDGTTGKLNWQVIVGISLGFLGLILIFKDNLAAFANLEYLFGIIAILLSNIFWAIGMMFTKKNYRKEDGIAVSSGLQSLSGAILGLILSLTIEDYSTINITTNSILALLYLVFLGSIVAYSCYAYALNNLPSTVVSMYTYINPIVAVFMGHLVLNEPLNAMIGVSSIVIIMGLIMVNNGYKKMKKNKSV